MSEDPRETLRRMEQGIASASEAAERLIADAARSTRRDRPPPAGWQMPGEDDADGRRPSELETLISRLRLVSELVPPEVLERLAAALRELLLAVRALIDFYVERLERPRQPPTHVQDIPIE